MLIWHVWGIKNFYKILSGNLNSKKQVGLHIREWDYLKYEGARVWN